MRQHLKTAHPLKSASGKRLPCAGGEKFFYSFEGKRGRSPPGRTTGQPVRCKKPVGNFLLRRINLLPYTGPRTGLALHAPFPIRTSSVFFLPSFEGQKKAKPLKPVRKFLLIFCFSFCDFGGGVAGPRIIFILHAPFLPPPHKAFLRRNAITNRLPLFLDRLPFFSAKRNRFHLLL